MSEHLKHEGRLTRNKLEAKTLKLKIEGLVKAMRENLDPFETVADLNLELVLEQAVEVRSLQVDYLEKLQEIGAIRKALGRD